MNEQQMVVSMDSNSEQKKEYSKPALVVLGKVSELTAGGSGPVGEGKSENYIVDGTCEVNDAGKDHC